MRVKELIEVLSQFDPELPVVVSGYEDGFNDVTEVKPLTIRLNVYQDWYYGAHAAGDDAEIQRLMPDALEVSAICLGGKNTNLKGIGDENLLRLWSRHTQRES